MNKIFDNKIIKNFKKYISTNILFCSYVIISLVLVTFLRVVTLGGLFSFKPLITDFSFILLIGSFGYFKKPDKQFGYYMFFIVLITLLCIINSIYVKFYDEYVTVTAINALGQIQGVNGAVIKKLSVLNFVYLIGPIIYFYINASLKKGKYFEFLSLNDKYKTLFKKTFIVSTVLVLLIIITTTSFDWGRLKSQRNRKYLVQRLGLYAYTISDVVKGLQPNISGTFNYDKAYKQFKEFYEVNYNKKEVNEYSNIFEGKNVLMIHMESIQSFLINLKINGQEITPNLNKLINKSLYFENFYPQISIGTSSDTEFTLNTSLMPSTSGIAFMSYSDRTFETLPNLFKQKGYYTFSMHGNDKEYWNREDMHKVLGYERFYSMEDYDIENSDNTYMGISDKDFFEQSISFIKEIDSQYDNYYGTLITLSNHTPWYNEEIYDDLDLTMEYFVKRNGNKIRRTRDWLEETEMGRYLESSHYADQALGYFIDKLEEEGLLDDTILVLYGDHQAKLPVSQFNLLYNFDPKTNDIKNEDDEDYIRYDKNVNFMNNKTPFIIYTGNTGIDLKGNVKDVMGMYDVLPTIANLFNTNTSKYALGKDVFSNKEHIVIFPNGNFITNKVYYKSTNNKYETLNGNTIDINYVNDMINYTETRLEVSNSLLVHDFIKRELEGEVK